MPTKFVPKVGVGQWVQLPEYMRRRMVEIFNLKRSGGAEVFNGRLISDGYMQRDLDVITVEKMQEFLKSEDKEYFSLFDKVLEYVENEKNGNLKKNKELTKEKEEAIQKVAISSALETIKAMSDAVSPIVKSRGRPAKEAL